MPRFWQALVTLIGRVLSIPLALLLLFEEWGWKPLAAGLATLARLRLIARLETLIAGLPPYAALAVFVLPSGLLFPVKIFGLYLLAKGQALLAGLLLAAAKVVSTALVARLFQLTRPALMQLAWFAGLYAWFVPWKEAVFARIRASWAWRYGRMVKARVRQEIRRAWQRWRPALMPHLEPWRIAGRAAVLRWRVWSRKRRRLPRDGSP